MNKNKHKKRELVQIISEWKRNPTKKIKKGKKMVMAIVLEDGEKVTKHIAIEENK